MAVALSRASPGTGQPSREKSVHTTPLWRSEIELERQGSETSGIHQPVGSAEDLFGRHGVERQFIVSLQEGGDLMRALLVFERASGIDESAARLQQPCRVVEQAALQIRKLANVARGFDVRNIGVT